MGKEGRRVPDEETPTIDSGTWRWRQAKKSLNSYEPFATRKFCLLSNRTAVPVGAPTLVTPNQRDLDF
jgi:hypothetical protein